MEKIPKRVAALEKRLSGEKLKLPPPPKNKTPKVPKARATTPKITPYKDRVKRCKRTRKPRQLHFFY